MQGPGPTIVNLPTHSLIPHAETDGEAVLRERDPTRAIPPLAGALVKNEQDVMLLERLAFMSRRANSR